MTGSLPWLRMSRVVIDGRVYLSVACSDELIAAHGGIDHGPVQAVPAARLYIRYGDLPEGGRSTNHRTGEREEGVSVYPVAWLGPDDYAPVLPSREALQTYYSSELHDRPAYLVRGRWVGWGSDMEPLLADVQIVQRIKPAVYVPTRVEGSAPDGTCPGCFGELDGDGFCGSPGCEGSTSGDDPDPEPGSWEWERQHGCMDCGVCDDCIERSRAHFEEMSDAD